MSILKNEKIKNLIIAIIAILFGAGGGATVVGTGMVKDDSNQIGIITPRKDLKEAPRIKDPSEGLEDGTGDPVLTYDYVVFCNCQYNYFRATVPFNEANSVPTGQGYTDLNNEIVAVPITTRKTPGAIDVTLMNKLKACGEPTTAIVSSIAFVFKEREYLE